MARRSGNGNNNLQDAMALLIQNQAQFLSHLTETHKRQNETDARLARMEGDLGQIKSILLRHDQVLADLPEVIRQKVGFKAK